MRVPQFLKRSPTLWLTLLAIVSFWGWCWYVEDGPQKEVLRAFALALPLGAFVRWAPAIYRMASKTKPIEGQQLSLGIVVAALGLFCSGVYLLTWQIGGQPLDAVNGELNSFWLWLVVIGYLLMLTSVREPDDHEIPWLGHVVLWGSLCLAALVAALITAYGPNLRPFAGWLLRFAF